MNPLLAVEDIHTFYGESHALQGVSFAVRPGEVVGLIGRNGVGKTTTLQTILGLPIPRSGVVRFRGEVVSGLPMHAIVRAGMAWVPQGHRIFPTLTTIENLSLAATHSRPGYWNLKKVLELFPRLAERRAAFGGTLSGGEQQMLAIGRALIQNPHMVLMDEPTEGLSPKIVEEVSSVIKLLRQQGCAIFLVEQNLTFALRLTDSIMVMNKGRIVFAGKPQELATNEDLCRHYLGVGASASVADVSKVIDPAVSH